MTAEHPFAQYVRIIGKGPHLSRPLTEEEMLDAARMIMAGDIEPVQLGAFLCVLRVRTEEPEEGAGFTRAVQETFQIPTDAPSVDLDWPSYAGKSRQLPWFVLAALLLAKNGVRVFMHGTEGHTENRIYAREALASLGIAPATGIDDACQQIRESNFAFMTLKDLAPRLQEIIELKSILGLRSPVNTFARMINPFRAAHELQSIFHPGYRDVHRDTAKILGQPHLAVFKGEGGEVERRPQKPVLIQSLHDGELSEEQWPPLIDDEGGYIDQEMEISRLGAVWCGEDEDAYATAAITGTVAVVLRLMGRADTPDQAFEIARRMWNERDRERLAA